MRERKGDRGSVREGAIKKEKESLNREGGLDHIIIPYQVESLFRRRPAIYTFRIKFDLGIDKFGDNNLIVIVVTPNSNLYCVYKLYNYRTNAYKQYPYKFNACGILIHYP